MRKKFLILLGVMLLCIPSVMATDPVEILLSEIPVYSPQDSDNSGLGTRTKCHRCITAFVAGDELSVYSELNVPVRVVVEDVLTFQKQCDVVVLSSFSDDIEQQGLYHIEIRTSEIALEGYFEIDN